MSSKIFYASLGAEIFRIGRNTTTESNNFKLSYQILISRMINKGAKLKTIEKCLGK